MDRLFETVDTRGIKTVEVPKPQEPAQVLLDAASQIFQVPVADILGRERFQKYVWSRHAFTMTARKFLKMSFPQIAHALRRDHTTVMSGHERAWNLYELDPDPSFRIGVILLSFVAKASKSKF